MLRRATELSLVCDAGNSEIEAAFLSIKLLTFVCQYARVKKYQITIVLWNYITH